MINDRPREICKNCNKAIIPPHWDLEEVEIRKDEISITYSHYPTCPEE